MSNTTVSTTNPGWLKAVDVASPSPQTPAQQLKQYLNLKTTITPTAQRSVRSQHNADQKHDTLEQIGESSCTRVYDLHSSGQVIKQAKSFCPHEELKSDLAYHRRIFADFRHANARVHVSRPGQIVNPAEIRAWCDRRREKGQVPAAHVLLERGTAFLLSERILPIPSQVRKLLIDVFCPEEQRLGAHLDEKNNNCLIRLYLGRCDDRTRRYDEAGKEFSLRNFELTLDRMEGLDEMDSLQFVKPMAEALAIMHWKTKCDASGVEFVLGTPPGMQPVKAETTWEQERRRSDFSTPGLAPTVRVWAREFDQVRDIELTPKGVGRAVEAFLDNDPYFPEPVVRPELKEYTCQQFCLWRKFKKEYLRKSTELMGKGSDLPQMFILRVEEESTKRLSDKIEEEFRRLTG